MSPQKIIAARATYFFIGKSFFLKQLSLLLLLPLRPHLAVALIFGWLASKYFKRFSFKNIYFVLVFATVFAFAVGGYGFIIGRNLRDGNAIVTPEIFQQDAWWRYLSNLVGLQFLSLDDRTVNFSVVRLRDIKIVL